MMLYTIYIQLYYINISYINLLVYQFNILLQNTALLDKHVMLEFFISLTYIRHCLFMFMDVTNSKLESYSVIFLLTGYILTFIINLINHY